MLYFLHQSQKWYGPKTQRYQVTSGQSLSQPPWKGVNRKGRSDTTEVIFGSGSNLDGDSSGVPAAPPAHLTAKDIVYEVDVDLPSPSAESEREVDAETAGLVEADIDNDESDAESSTSILVTAREYGQTGNGALAEFVLKRQLGETAVARTSSKQSSEVSTVTSASVQPQMMLEPPAPGRLRLLSGITASFEPGTLNAVSLLYILCTYCF